MKTTNQIFRNNNKVILDKIMNHEDKNIYGNSFTDPLDIAFEHKANLSLNSENEDVDLSEDYDQNEYLDHLFI